MGDKLDGILDVTVAYGSIPLDAIPENTIGFSSLIGYSKGPTAIHYHVRYYNIKSLPLADEAQLTDWLYKVYREKDYLIEEFHENRCFPGRPAPQTTFVSDTDMLLSYAISACVLFLWIGLVVLLVHMLIIVFGLK